MQQMTLVVGGMRSGKSRFAEQLAASSPPVTYIATAQAGDADMVRRIRAHRQRRPGPWRTVEEPWDLAGVLATRPSAGCVLVECLTFWLTNLLVGLPEHPALEEAAIMDQIDALLEAVESRPGGVIVVTSEVGCGLLPPNELARRFGDLVGDANQRLAAAAGAVYVCMAGIPQRLK
jgi:adenosylcobinamide kinase/adenosylcobinamide-phosphate guanylyltransferase